MQANVFSFYMDLGVGSQSFNFSIFFLGVGKSHVYNTLKSRCIEKRRYCLSMATTGIAAKFPLF